MKDPVGVARRRGRTPEIRLRRDAQKLASLALETLRKILESDGQETIKLAAAREILDRGHGRPKLGANEAEAEGMTVIVRRFTDPPTKADV